MPPNGAVLCFLNASRNTNTGSLWEYLEELIEQSHFDDVMGAMVAIIQSVLNIIVVTPNGGVGYLLPSPPSPIDLKSFSILVQAGPDCTNALWSEDEPTIRASSHSVTFFYLSTGGNILRRR
jgi:hypothetical protein